MRQMKDSGVAWIGDIPIDWSIGRVKMAFERKKDEAHQENPVILSLARSGVKVRDISSGEGQIADSYYNYNPVSVGDFLLNPMDLYSGANCSISKVEGVISPAYINLKAKPQYDPSYYDYYFKTQYWAMAMFAHGKGVSFDNRWTLSPNDLMNYYIPIPSYSEQISISSFIDRQCAHIDNIIEKTKTSVEEYKKLKQTIITQAVTKGIRGNRSMKESGIAWIGEVPEEWKVCKFKHIICKKIDNRGRTPDLLDNNNGIPIVEVASLGKKHPDLSAVKKHISKESHDEYIRDDVETGDLLITTVGATIGKCSIVDVPCFCIAQNLVGYRVNRNNYPLFWYYYFQSYAFQDMFALYDKGNTINNVKISNMEQGSIVVASYDEQLQIAEYLDKKCAEIDSLIAKKEQFLKDIENYKKSLIYEYVTGKKEILA